MPINCQSVLILPLPNGGGVAMGTNQGENDVPPSIMIYPPLLREWYNPSSYYDYIYLHSSPNVILTQVSFTYFSINNLLYTSLHTLSLDTPYQHTTLLFTNLTTQSSQSTESEGSWSHSQCDCNFSIINGNNNHEIKAQTRKILDF